MDASFKSKEEIYNYLKSLAVAVLSTVSDEGKPDASPIYFVADEELSLYFISPSDTTKSKNIINNTNAAIAIIDPRAPKTIQAKGRVIKVSSPKTYRKFIAIIAEANAKGKGFYWPPPLSKVDSQGDLIMYKFKPSWMRFADFTKSSDVFFQVIP